MRPSTLLAFISSAALAASTAWASSTARLTERDDNPDDPTGKILYITEPACGYYRCVVTWPVGSPVSVNWLGPPSGSVSVSLVSNIGGPTYPIVDSIPSISQEGYCDSGYGMGVVAPGHECGRVEFVVPLKWERMDNYTIVVQSLSNPDLIGYTDMITISGPDSSSEVSNPPTGTAVSLLTIPDPTATNKGVATRYTGKIPHPTAVTGAGAAARESTTSAAAESSASSSLSSATRAQRGSSSSSSLSASSSESLSASASSTSPTAMNATAGAQSAASSTKAATSPSATGAASAGALIGRGVVGLAAGIAALAMLTL